MQNTDVVMSVETAGVWRLVRFVRASPDNLFSSLEVPHHIQIHPKTATIKDCCKANLS